MHRVDDLVQEHVPAAAKGHDELTEESALAHLAVQKGRSLELPQAGQHGRLGDRSLIEIRRGLGPVEQVLMEAPQVLERASPLSQPRVRLANRLGHDIVMPRPLGREFNLIAFRGARNKWMGRRAAPLTGINATSIVLCFAPGTRATRIVVGSSSVEVA